MPWNRNSINLLLSQITSKVSDLGYFPWPKLSAYIIVIITLQRDMFHLTSQVPLWAMICPPKQCATTRLSPT